MQTEKTVEDYLEAMLMIRQRSGYVRSIDVAQELNVTKPSVTYATKRLKEKGYITMDKDNFIFFTESGIKIAERVYNRHKTLMAFFISLGVDEETARQDACRVEHDLSRETFNALCRYINANIAPEEP